MYIVLFTLLMMLYFIALAVVVRTGSTTIFVVVVIIVLLALFIATLFATVLAIMNSIEDGRGEDLRKRLLKETASVNVRTVGGEITNREQKGDKFLVTILVGSRTYFVADDEDAFFASYSNSNVRVKFREHRDIRNKVIHREIIQIIL